MTVGELEAALFVAFPRADAEPWDHVGLSVGDPGRAVGRVMVALDATEDDVRAAHAAGADVLVTHHPVYIKAPGAFTPEAGPGTPQSAAAVYQAAALGVSVISMHTNLDRSLPARELLPSLVGFTATNSLEHAHDPERTGFGAVAEHRELSLAQLARLCATAFGTVPRIWGATTAPVRRTAFMGGSAGDVAEDVLAAGCGALVCGEAGYHVCQDLAARGCGVVLLGHDASELPFRRILVEALVHAGIARDAVTVRDQERSWWTLGEREEG